VLGRRILTAAVLILLLAGAVLSGSVWPFPLFVGGAVLLCAAEYSGMFFSSPSEQGVLVAAALLAYASGAFLPGPLSLPAVLVCAGLAAFSFIGGERTPPEKARAAGLAALGVLYIGGCLSTYIWTIRLPEGRHWVLLGIVAVAAGDTAAYFTGRAFGRRPLSPRVSPNKTLEGAGGGLAASLAAGTCYAAVFLPSIPWTYAALVSALVGAAGQAGDLFESLLKRAAGVKDSGTILPGHGGMFDRADAAIAAGPVLYLAAVLSSMVGGAG
jgi:phosphatidate cytidylyltransferase